MINRKRLEQANKIACRTFKRLHREHFEGDEKIFGSYRKTKSPFCHCAFCTIKRKARKQSYQEKCSDISFAEQIKELF